MCGLRLSHTNMTNSEEDEVEVQEDDQQIGLSLYFCFSAIFVMILIFMTMIMYRASRPVEIDSVFEYFDCRLEGPQRWLEM